MFLGISMTTMVLLIMLVIFILFMTEIIPIPATAMACALAFYFVGAIDAKTVVASFSSGTAMIIAAMAVIGESVFKTGGADDMGNMLKRFATDEKKMIFAIVIGSGCISAFLSNTGAVALIIPLVLGICSSTGMRRCKLIYPIIVGAVFGGGITIVGSNSGPFLREALDNLHIGQTMNFFEFAPLSIILLIVSAFYLSTLGYKLLPEKSNNEDGGVAAPSKENLKPMPKWKKTFAFSVMACTFILMIFEKQIGLPLHFIAIIGALLVVSSKCLTMKEAARSVPINGIILYAAMVPVAKAMSNSGAAKLIAKVSLDILGSLNSPILVVIIIFLIITPITNFMSNAATIILFTPVAIVVANTLAISPKPILVAIRFAASIAIATPVAMPITAMIVEPGGYTFMDFVRPGLPLTIICIVISVIYISIFYPLGIH